MIPGANTGASPLATARHLAKEHGVDVLGWNDQPGSEFISVNGAGDKLLALQKEMEKLGWHAWPVAEEQEGAFMDFALRPPPVAARAPKSAEEVDVSETAVPPTFHYTGPGSLFRTQWPWLGGLAALAVYRLTTPAASTRVLMAIVAFALIFAILVVCDWIEITAADGKLTVRKHFFGKIRNFEMADLKAAKIFNPTDRRGRRQGEFLHIIPKSGKSFDVFLPARKQRVLAAWLRARVHSVNSV